MSVIETNHHHLNLDPSKITIGNLYKAIEWKAGVNAKHKVEIKRSHLCIVLLINLSWIYF